MKSSLSSTTVRPPGLRLCSSEQPSLKAASVGRTTPAQASRRRTYGLTAQGHVVRRQHLRQNRRLPFRRVGQSVVLSRPPHHTLSVSERATTILTEGASARKCHSAQPEATPARRSPGSLRGSLASSSPAGEERSACSPPVPNLAEDGACHEQRPSARVYVIIRDGTVRFSRWMKIGGHNSRAHDGPPPPENRRSRSGRSDDPQSHETSPWLVDVDFFFSGGETEGPETAPASRSPTSFIPTFVRIRSASGTAGWHCAIAARTHARLSAVCVIASTACSRQIISGSAVDCSSSSDNASWTLESAPSISANSHESCESRTRPRQSSGFAFERLTGDPPLPRSMRADPLARRVS